MSSQIRDELSSLIALKIKVKRIYRGLPSGMESAILIESRGIDSAQAHSLA